MKRKSKIIGGSIVALAAVGTFSVGFASWVIGGDSSSVTGNISVTVSDIEDQRLEIVVNSGSDATFNFGPSTETSGGLVYLSGSTTEEDLDANILLDLKTYTLTSNKKITVTFSYAENFATAIEDGLITAPIAGEAIELATVTAADTATSTVESVAASVATSDTVTVSEVTKTIWSVTPNTGTAAEGYTYRLSFAVKFGWGSAFNYVNPVTLSSKDTNPATNSAWTATALKSALETLESVETLTSTDEANKVTSPITITITETSVTA